MEMCMAGAAGVVATVCHDLIMTPMDVVKQRLQLGYYNGVSDCFKSVIRQEGARALYISFPTTFLMNLPYRYGASWPALIHDVVHSQ